MFKNEFQGGPFVDVFTSQGKEPLAKWKLSAATSSFKKVYEKELKGYCHVVEGSTASTNMQLPKDHKQALVLIQRFFVMQLYVSLGQDFSVELGICNMSNNKRRVVLSTSHKEVSVTTLHAKIPLAIIKKAMWLNLCFDLLSLVGEAFPGQAFKSLDSITISATCKLRKIFTLKVQPIDNTDDDDLYMCSPATNDTDVEQIPAQCQFNKDVPYQTQVINMNKLRHANCKSRGEPITSRPTSSTETDLNASLRGKDKGPTHIAFGSRVRIPSSPTTKKTGSAGNREGINSAGNPRSSHCRSQHVDDSPRRRTSKDHVDTLVIHNNKHDRQQSAPGTLVNDVKTNIDKESLSGSRTWSGEGGAIQSEVKKPHPPRERSRESSSRRVVKVRPSNGTKSGNASSRSDDASSRSGSGDVTTRRQYDKSKYSDPVNSNRRDRNESESSVELDDDVQRLLNAARERLAQTKQDCVEQDNSRSNSNKVHRTKPTDSMSDSDDMLTLSGGSVSLKTRNKKPFKVRQEKRRMESFSENDEQHHKCNEMDTHSADDRTSESGVVSDNNFADEEDVGQPSSDLVRSSEGPKMYTFSSKPKAVPSSKARERSLKEHRNNTAVGHPVRNGQFSKPQHPQNDYFSQTSEDEEKYRVVIKKPFSPRQDTSSSDARQSPHEIVELTMDNVENSQHRPKSSNSPTMSRRPSKLQSARSNLYHNISNESRPSKSRMSIKKLKEILRDDPRLSTDKKVVDASPSGSSENRLSDDYDWRNDHSYNSSLASSLEASMLRSLKRQQLEEALEDESSEDHINAFTGIDADVSDSSDDSATTSSTWQLPAPALKPYDYMGDTHRQSQDNNPLMQSNPRDWSKMFSPPIVPVSERIREEEQTTAVQLSPVMDTGDKGLEESDDELDLLYDPCLNCYFDPKTHKYYELA